MKESNDQIINESIECKSGEKNEDLNKKVKQL